MMKKVLDSFINENQESFCNTFNKHKMNRLINREDYHELKEKKDRIYEKYPKIQEFIEDKKPANFEEEEIKAFSELTNLNIRMSKLELIEAYKLGAKEAYIFFEEMDMLNI